MKLAEREALIDALEQFAKLQVNEKDEAIVTMFMIRRARAALEILKGKGEEQ